MFATRTAVCSALLAIFMVGVAGCGTTGTGSSIDREVGYVIGQQHRFPRARDAIQSAKLSGVEQAMITRGPVLERGMALLQANMPHDVRRTDVPRWLSARALFGQWLTRYAQAFEQGRPADGFAMLQELEDALAGWSDATNGIAPETAV